MSTENEIANQSGNNHPDDEPETQQEISLEQEPALELSPEHGGANMEGNQQDDAVQPEAETAIDIEPDSEQEEQDLTETVLESNETAVASPEAADPEPETAAEDEDTEQDWDTWLDADPELDETASEPELVEESDTVAADEEIAFEEEREALTPSEDDPEASSAEKTAEAVEAEAEESTEIAAKTEEAEVVEDDADSPEEPPVEVEPSPPAKPKKVNPSGLKTKDVISYFAPCGRCGYFLTGYRALYGNDNLETAVAEAVNNWLTLSWGLEMRELVLKSYGTQMESNDLHYDGCCSECRRIFTFEGVRNDDQPTTFNIEIKPQK